MCVLHSAALTSGLCLCFGCRLWAVRPLRDALTQVAALEVALLPRLWAHLSASLASLPARLSQEQADGHQSAHGNTSSQRTSSGLQQVMLSQFSSEDVAALPSMGSVGSIGSMGSASLHAMMGGATHLGSMSSADMAHVSGPMPALFGVSGGMATSQPMQMQMQAMQMQPAIMVSGPHHMGMAGGMTLMPGSMQPMQYGMAIPMQPMQMQVAMHSRPPGSHDEAMQAGRRPHGAASMAVHV